MSVDHRIFLAGFGGQGILFAGKFLVYAGMIAGYEVSWLPSYGPEMRGGTCNCSVNISTEPVGSPIIINPNILVVMNNPSFDSFEGRTVAGGSTFIDSSLVDRKSERDDVNTFYIPATKLARENGTPKSANMIIVGKLLKELSLFESDIIEKTMKKLSPPNKPEIYEVNMKALNIGYNL